MATTVELRPANTVRTISNDDIGAMNAPTYVNTYLLTADIVKTVNIPSNANYVAFSPVPIGDSFYVRYDDELPPTWPDVIDVTNGSGWYPNPGQLFLDQGYSKIYLVSAVDMRVATAFYNVKAR